MSDKSAIQGIPVVVLLGPSGAGKSELAKALREQLGWYWIEADVFCVPNGIAEVELQREWDQFRKSGGDATLLRSELQRRASEQGCSGVVLSLASTKTVIAQKMERARETGVWFVVVFGAREECKAAFEDRERRSPRGLNLDGHWNRFNATHYPKFADPSVAPFWLAAFRNGQRRSLQELVKDVCRLVGRDPPPRPSQVERE